jgi:peptidoglycan/LPS O-acetylase OafA/YrhL
MLRNDRLPTIPELASERVHHPGHQAGGVIKNVQGLRFLAAAWVALFHLNLLSGLGMEVRWLSAFAGLGYAGVDVFFVISGYIMALTTAGTTPGAGSAARFATQRFARIYCGWWPFFLIYLAYYTATGGIRAEMRLLPSFFLWPTLLPHHLLPIAWTLSFELFFYAGTAAVLTWNRRKAWLPMAAWEVLVVVLNAAWLVQGRYHPDQAADVTFAQWFVFFPLTLEFVAGFVLHDYLRRHGPGSWIPWAAGAALFGLAIAAYLRVGTFHPSGLAGLFHAPERAVLWGGFSACVVATAVRLEDRGRTPLAWLAPLGDASYSIYLGHILLIQLFLRFLPGLGATALPKTLVFVAVFVVLVALLWLYYLWVERPFYVAVKRRISGLYGGPRLEPTAR